MSDWPVSAFPYLAVPGAPDAISWAYSIRQWRSGPDALDRLIRIKRLLEHPSGPLLKERVELILNQPLEEMEKQIRSVRWRDRTGSVIKAYDHRGVEVSPAGAHWFTISVGGEDDLITVWWSKLRWPSALDTAGTLWCPAWMLELP